MIQGPNSHVILPAASILLGHALVSCDLVFVM